MKQIRDILMHVEACLPSWWEQSDVGDTIIPRLVANPVAYRMEHWRAYVEDQI